MDSIRVAIFPTFFISVLFTYFRVSRSEYKTEILSIKKITSTWSWCTRWIAFLSLRRIKWVHLRSERFLQLFLSHLKCDVYTYFIHVRAYYLFKIKWSEKPKIIKIRHFYFIELNDYCVWSKRYFNTSLLKMCCQLNFYSE